jgi:signal transduction histidine kinase
MVGVAILKYRLYEIDVVIKKTVVFTILVGMLMAIGVVAAIALGGSLMDRAQDRPEVTLLVGVVLGLLFIPLYRLSRRIADRVVFRGRAGPYEVLRSFAGRVGETYSNDDVLPRMARVLAEATGASRARVWVRVGDQLRVGASWPLDGPSTEAADLVDGSPSPDLDDHIAEVRHGGDLLGVLSIRMPPNDPMTPSKESLVGDLASQAGLVLRNVRLIEELRESRRRIVAAQDERANKLERDIHDGAQQQLVALAVKERLAESLIGKDEERLRAMLRQLRTETESALQDLRDLARGIYPPLLADEGLTAALGSQVRRSVIPVTIETDGVGRYAREVEAAIYFSVLEALQNASKYSAADHAIVVLRQFDGVLSFEVTDDGGGFDPESVARGSGLRGMADRIEAVGGELLIESAPDQGTRVRGHVPVAGTPGGGNR